MELALCSLSAALTSFSSPGSFASVGEHGGDEDQMIAGLLHDYLEDIEGASV
ncbi:MAG: hypothetical protein GXP55_14830, partial [Deltaproteobacteria bacterium]|nr:hypothetical protein [Deltaproteobacteria bacterium]